MDDIIRFVQTNQRFAVTSHARPDGDSIGSSLGLALGLEQLGKTVDLFGSDVHPHRYDFLPGVQNIQVADHIEGDYDGLFVLECSELGRPGLRNLERFLVINLDHHPYTKPFGNLNWLDPTASAVGEMVYYLIKGLSAQLTPEIATNLYVAIMTDTGSFQFSNTHAKTFQVAGDLVSCGANPSTIAQTVYMNQPHSKFRLLSTLLGDLELHASQKIASVTLTQKMLKETRASLQDLEGLVNYPLSMEGVLLAIFFREEADKQYRVSLRSKNHYDVATVAKQFGGGGHRNAAGLSIQGNFEEVRNALMSALEKLLD